MANDVRTEDRPRGAPLSDETGVASAELLRRLVPVLRERLDRHEHWVLFEHGTVVLLDDPGVDPSSTARLKLTNDAEQPSGTAAGDPSVMRLDQGGWIVSSHDPDTFTIVPEATIDPGSSDVVIGLAGRAAHEADTHGGAILHVQSPFA